MHDTEGLAFVARLQIQYPAATYQEEGLAKEALSSEKNELT